MCGDTALEKPKIGDKIPVKKFHVSKCNMRYDKPFGESKEDQLLIKQLRFGKVVQPFKARPEEDGYGVYTGRRRFLAKKRFRKEFEVGKDVIILDIKPEDAKEESLIENLRILQKDVDPMTRARALSDIVYKGGGGLRSTARRLGLPKSTLGDWLKALDLSPGLQATLEKGLMTWKDARTIARMKVSNEKQEELAEILETKGLEAFKEELAKVVPKGKRGIPAGKYIIDRVVWDKANKFEVQYYETLRSVAEAKKMTVPELIKDYIVRHIEDIKKEVSG